MKTAKRTLRPRAMEDAMVNRKSEQPRQMAAMMIFERERKVEEEEVGL